MMMQYVGWLSYLFPSNHLLIKYETIPAITEIINEIKEVSKLKEINKKVLQKL